MAAQHDFAALGLSLRIPPEGGLIVHDGGLVVRGLSKLDPATRDRVTNDIRQRKDAILEELEALEPNQVCSEYCNYENGKKGCYECRFADLGSLPWCWRFPSR